MEKVRNNLITEITDVLIGVKALSFNGTDYVNSQRFNILRALVVFMKYTNVSMKQPDSQPTIEHT